MPTTISFCLSDFQILIISSLGSPYQFFKGKYILEFFHFQEDLASNEEKADKDFVSNSEKEQCINTPHIYQVPNLLLDTLS